MILTQDGLLLLIRAETRAYFNNKINKKCKKIHLSVLKCLFVQWGFVSQNGIKVTSSPVKTPKLASDKRAGMEEKKWGDVSTVEQYTPHRKSLLDLWHFF